MKLAEPFLQFYYTRAMRVEVFFRRKLSIQSHTTQAFCALIYDAQNARLFEVLSGSLSLRGGDPLDRLLSRLEERLPSVVYIEGCFLFLYWFPNILH